MSERVSDERLAFLLEFGLGGEGEAKATATGIALDLRDERTERKALAADYAECVRALALADEAFAVWAKMGDALHSLMPAKDDVAGATQDKWQAVANSIIEADDIRPRVQVAFLLVAKSPRAVAELKGVGR